jgi:proteasome beta subunit
LIILTYILDNAFIKRLINVKKIGPEPMSKEFEKMHEEALKKAFHGTTTTGIVCKDGVVLATDKRATSGSFIASKTVNKIYKIGNHLASTMAGRVADAQSIMDVIRAEAALFEIEYERSMPVKAASNLMANILFGSRFFPYYIQTIVAGVDDEGSHAFNLDFFGSIIREDYICTGSGSPIAYAIIEENYHEDITVEEALAVLIRAVNAAMNRDSASGDGFNAVKITREEGYQELSKEDIEKIIKKFIKKKSK